MDTWNHLLGSSGRSAVKNPPAVREIQETWVWCLGWEDPLEEGMATHSSVLTWRIPMDRGAWQAVVQGVWKSWTLLGDWTHTHGFIADKRNWGHLPPGVSHLEVGRETCDPVIQLHITACAFSDSHRFALDFSYPGNKNFNLVVIKKLWSFDHCFVAKN